MSQQAFVLGQGPVGRGVAQLLVERGYSVVIGSRSGRDSGMAGVRTVAVDAMDAEALVRATEGSSFIFHCANRSYEHWFKVLPGMQAAVIRAGSAHGATVASSENLYLYRFENQTLTEQSPMGPATRKGQLRQKLFEDLMAAHQGGKLQAVTVRASDYYGPGAEDQAHFGKPFLKPLLAGKTARLVGDHTKRHSFTYLPDYSRALVEVALRPEAHGRAWHAPTLPAITMRAMAETFAAKAGKPLKLGRLTRPMIYLAGAFVPGIREFVEMLYQFENDFVVDSSDFEKTFGIRPTPLDEGVQKTIEWYSRTHAME